MSSITAQLLRRSLGMLMLIAGTLIVGCSEENGVDGPDQANSLVSGDPELNTFLITSLDESVVTVDPQTGQEQVIYTFDQFNEPASLPDYTNGYIVVPTEDNSVNALDVNSQSFVWSVPMLEYEFSSLGISATVCHEGTCYTSGTFGVVVATDALTGEVQWYYSVSPSGSLDDVLYDAGTPIVRGDKVYVVSEEGFISDLPAYIHVLDKASGELIEKYELPFEVSGDLVFSGDMLFLSADNLYALDAETFEMLWQFEAEGVGIPSIAGDRLVVHGIASGESIYSALFCLDKNTGTLIWQLETGFDTVWSPVIVEDVVFGVYEEATSIPFARNGRPFAVSLSEGTQIWFRDDVAIDHSPVYANGRLFFHGHDIGKEGDIEENVGLICMNPNNGEVLWLNNFFRSGSALAPLVVAQNGIFGPSYYRGNGGQ